MRTPTPSAKTARQAQRCLSVGDLQARARRYLPRVIYDYLEGGADDEECLAENPARLRRHKLRPRYLVDISNRSQRVSVFGRDYRAPFGISPMGMLGMVRQGGDLMLARVAAQSGIPFILSGACNASVESVARDAPGSWLQFYPCKDLAIERDMLARAAGAGIGTLVVAVDVPLHSKRERNIRSGWVRPYKPSAAVILEALRHPAWVARYLRHGIPVMENFLPYAPAPISARALTGFYASQVPAAHGWPMVERLRRQWRGQLVLKGILAAEDARLAAFGAAGAQRAVDILRGELDLTLGQIGCPDVRELGPRFLWQAGP